MLDKIERNMLSSRFNIGTDIPTVTTSALPLLIPVEKCWSRQSTLISFLCGIEGSFPTIVSEDRVLRSAFWKALEP